MCSAASLYEHAGWSGAWHWYNSSSSWLGDFNDRTSSIRFG
ncbi:hypothetical protein [Streptomyces jumonjinensis]